MKIEKAILLTTFLIFSYYTLIAKPPSNFQSIPLSDILQQLKSKKKVAFLYEPSTVKDIFIHTPFNYRDDTKTILKTILPPIGLTFKKIGRKNFIIKKAKNKIPSKKEELSQSKSPTPILKQKAKSEQLKTIQGTLVSEEEGQPLIGATIRLKNSNIGASTDENGNYQITIPNSENVLVYSYIGYQEKEVAIKEQRRQNIRLKSTVTDFDEIIVTAVGIEANKRALAYAAENINIKELSKANTPNLVSALSAQSSGVWVNTASGSPGASASIFIRGLHSVNGNNKPLFVLDGVPVDNTTTGNGTGGVDVSNRLIDLNSHDIDQITILKGATATALYGIRAANGAIILTSKKGKQGKPKIQFSSALASNTVNKLPQKQTTYSQGRFRNGQATYLGPESNTASSYGPNINTLEFDGATDYPYDKNGQLVPIGTGNGQAPNIYDANDAFFVNGRMLDNHLSISGGTNWFNYYVSFGHVKQTGVVPRSTFERYSIKGVFNVQLHEKIKMGMYSYLSQSSGFRMKRGSLFSGVPLGLFRNPITFDIGNGQKGTAASNSPNTYMFENGMQRAFRSNGSYDNPFWSVNRNPFEDKVNRIIQNLNFEYQPLSWLRAHYKFGLDVYDDNRKNAYDINSGTHRLGQINVFDIQSNNYNSDLLLIANQDLNEDWTIQTTIGHNYFSSEFSIEEIIGEELEKQGVYQISNAIYTSTDETILRKKVAGIFTDILLQYKNILYLNFTGRNDWSSTLPKSNNSFFYPSVNLGFEFTELFNWSNSEWLSYGKLRLSFGQAGNDAGTYLTDSYFNSTVINGDDLLPNVDFPAFGISAFERSAILGNPLLKPETTTTYEGGVDLKWLKGRLNTDFTIYKSLHKDQIVNTQLSAASGFLRMPINGGTIQNHGLEANISIIPIQRNNFKWKSSINFSTYKSLVTDLPNNYSGITLASFTNISSMIIEGQPYGVLVGTSIKRDEQGRMIIDQNGFPKVNETQTIIGDPNPDALMGILNEFEWRGFRLSGLLDIRKGGDVWNGTRGVMNFLGTSKESGDLRNTTDYVFDGVTENGETNTKPVDFANPANGMRGIYWRRYGFIGLGEQHIENASWIRLRNLSLSYDFQKRWTEKNTSHFTISIIGNNVFLWTRYSGVDPETNLRGDSNIMGWDYFTMPSTKGWMMQLVASF